MITEAIILICWIQFVNACFWEGQIFEKIGYWLETKMHWLYMPTVGCPICMSPWHGLFAWLIFEINPWAIVIAAGINVIIIRWTPEQQSNSLQDTDSNSSERAIVTDQKEQENI